MGELTYAVVTPARNEAANLCQLAVCLAEQDRPPLEWVIVDNGSTDDTADVAAELAASSSWTQALFAPGEANPTRGAPVARAFAAGVAALTSHADVVVKVDADITFERDYFDRLIGEFERDATLGIASGTCYELDDGEWRARHVTAGRARGASRAFRRECLDSVLPLEERIGWDGIDEVRAAARGWRTTSFPHVFLHHRTVGGRDASLWRTRTAHGRTAHYIGYRFSYLVLRALFRAREHPAALAMIWGYVDAMVRRQPRSSDVAARAHVRELQGARQLRQRIREARGRTGSG